MRMLELYDYLADARSWVFDQVGRLTPTQYAREFPFGRKSIRATLVHTLDTEGWYVRMLRGEPEGRQSPYTELRRGGFPPLKTAWQQQALRTRDALEALGDPDRPIEGRFWTIKHVRGVRTTAGAIAIQLLFHEVHHRAQVMVMLRYLGHPVQSVDYNLMRWEWFGERG